MSTFKKYEEFLNEATGQVVKNPPSEKDIVRKDKYKKGDWIYYRVNFGASPMIANSKNEVSDSVYLGKVEKASKHWNGLMQYTIGWSTIPHDMVIGMKK